MAWIARDKNKRLYIYSSRPERKSDEWMVYTEERGFYYVYLGKTGLSFPKSSMAEEFINTFKDLLEVAKPLI